jgi:hypothetical protein
MTPPDGTTEKPIEIPPQPNTPYETVEARDAAAREALAPANPDMVAEKLARAEPVRVARRGFFHDTPDRGLFLLFAGVGFVGVLILKLTSTNAIISAFTAVALIIAYAVLTWRIPHYRLHPDRLGENCYYLGFLYTLASLSAALIVIEQAGEAGRALAIERIIGDFGIALFSTIAGVALRVAFMQIRREVEDLEEEIRNDLRDVASALKDKLWLSVSDLENFRLRTRQVMDEQVDSTVTEQVTAVRRIRQETERITEGIDRLAQRINNLDIPPDLLARQFAAVEGRIATLGAGFEATIKADLERQAVTATLISNLTSAVTRLADTGPGERAQRASDALSAAVVRTNEQLQSFRTLLEEIRKAYAVHAQQGVSDAQALRALRGAMANDLDAARETLRSLQDAMSDVADGIVRKLGT